MLIVEAPAGEPRRRWLERWLQETSGTTPRRWLLSCRFEDGGPWAGVHDLFASLIDEVRERRPDLLARHDYELVHVLPELQRWMKVRHPTLTDLAPQDERVRNYPADRAVRIVHGLIDLLVACTGDSDVPWVIACDDYEAVGAIGHCFFRQLVRRRGSSLRLALALATSPGSGDELGTEFAAAWEGPVLRLDLPALAEPAVHAPREELVRIARALEDEVKENNLETHIRLPELIRAWRLAGHPGKLAHWQVKGLELYNVLGLYEDAIRNGEAARALLKEHSPNRHDQLWFVFLKLFMAYAALGRPEMAERLVREDMAGTVDDPRHQWRLSYLLAMLHSRYMPNRDLRRGEEYLERGLRELRQADLPEGDFHFHAVFNRNGLAMIRHFQGRYQEAIELCREGFQDLERHLHQDRHRLHRSVLLYNMAQVYTAVGAHDDALRHFSLAMEMDPNYSEYYNDRGSVYLKIGNFEAACADYRKAIALSPPYHEVYTNLGQCYRRMSRWDDAIRAYSVSLDLEPQQALALAARGQCHEAQKRLAMAAADYTASLALDPGQWDVLASRAVVSYMVGDLAASLADLDRAVELAPQQADLYQNRAVALADLGRCTEAARDLETYLHLQPDTEDRPEIELRLQKLAGASLRPRTDAIPTAQLGG